MILGREVSRGRGTRSLGAAAAIALFLPKLQQQFDLRVGNRLRVAALDIGVTQALSDPIATLAVQSGHGSFDDHASGVVRREMYHESTRPNLKEPYRNRQEGAMVTRIASRWLIKTYR